MTDPSASSLGNALKETLEGLIEGADAHLKTEVGKLESEARTLEWRIKEAKLKEQGVLPVAWGNTKLTAEPKESSRTRWVGSLEWSISVGPDSMVYISCSSNRTHWGARYYKSTPYHSFEGMGDTPEDAVNELHGKMTACLQDLFSALKGTGDD